MTSPSKPLQVQQVKISELKPSTYNPRIHSDRDLEQLMESIRRFGLCDPLIVNGADNRKNVIIGGHMRLLAAKKLGKKSVPVIYVNIPDLEREKELNLRLNRNTGSWSLEMLKEFDASFLLDVGFDDNDLEDIWNDMLEVEDDNFDIEKKLDEIKNPETKLGDLWILGEHRLFCGDSGNPESIRQATAGQKVEMLYFDPVYDISLDYNKGIGGKANYGGTTNDNKGELVYKEFLLTCISNALLYCKDDAHIFCYCDQLKTGLVQEIYQELGITPKRVCLWIKDGFNPTPKVAFNKGYEPCVYGTRGNPKLYKQANLNEILNKEVGTGNSTIEDIIDIFDIWLAKRDPMSTYQHPTQKPPSLHEKAIKRCTKYGDRILDWCAGGGSLLIACEQMKRKCYAVEIEPVFCDVIVARWEELTGLRAKLFRNDQEVQR